MIIKPEKKITSPKNNEIRLLKVETPDGKKGQTVLLIGVFHGDEPEGEYLIDQLIKDIKENPDLTGNNEILIIPCLNPDGKQENIRGNSNGIDLNRNFPTKNRPGCDEAGRYNCGYQAASEVETLFIMDIVEEYKPDRILAFHSPYKVVNYDGPAEKIAEKMSGLNGYPVQVDIGYPTPGSFGTYAGKERNIPVITLELPGSGDVQTMWQDNRKALHYFISA